MNQHSPPLEKLSACGSMAVLRETSAAALVSWDLIQKMRHNIKSLHFTGRTQMSTIQQAKFG